jgi:hypothetical protein
MPCAIESVHFDVHKCENCVHKILHPHFLHMISTAQRAGKLKANRSIFCPQRRQLSNRTGPIRIFPQDRRLRVERIQFLLTATMKWLDERIMR